MNTHQRNPGNLFGRSDKKKDPGSARQGETTNTKKRAAARIALTC
jgi:hypothetical protein